MRARLLDALIALGVVILGFLLGTMLLAAFTEPEPQPEPIVIVCTWTQGCEQTDEPVA